MESAAGCSEVEAHPAVGSSKARKFRGTGRAAVGHREFAASIAAAFMSIVAFLGACSTPSSTGLGEGAVDATGLAHGTLDPRAPTSQLQMSSESEPSRAYDRPTPLNLDPGAIEVPSQQVDSHEDDRTAPVAEVDIRDAVPGGPLTELDAQAAVRGGVIDEFCVRPERGDVLFSVMRRGKVMGSDSLDRHVVYRAESLHIAERPELELGWGDVHTVEIVDMTATPPKLVGSSDLPDVLTSAVGEGGMLYLASEQLPNDSRSNEIEAYRWDPSGQSIAPELIGEFELPSDRPELTDDLIVLPGCSLEQSGEDEGCAVRAAFSARMDDEYAIFLLVIGERAEPRLTRVTPEGSSCTRPRVAGDVLGYHVEPPSDAMEELVTRPLDLGEQLRIVPLREVGE